MKLLVPAYDYQLLKSAVSLAPKLKGKLAVVINPNSGPGARRDPVIATALQLLRKDGAEVWFYLDCVAGPNFSAVMDKEGKFKTPGAMRAKTEWELEREVRQYEKLYCSDAKGALAWVPAGWFMDDTTTKAHISAGSGACPPMAKQLWNPGNANDAIWMDFSGDVVCYFEDELFAEHAPKQNPLKRARGAVLSLKDDHWKLSLEVAVKQRAAYFFATDVTGNPWAKAPSYFNDLAAAVLATRD